MCCECTCLTPWCFSFIIQFRIFLSTVSSLLFNPVQFNIVQRITCCNCWLLFKTLKMQGRISGFIHDIYTGYLHEVR